MVFRLVRFFLMLLLLAVPTGLFGQDLETVLFNVGSSSRVNSLPAIKNRTMLRDTVRQTHIVQLKIFNDSTVAGRILADPAEGALKPPRQTPFGFLLNRIRPGDTAKLNQELKRAGKLEYLYIDTLDLGLLQNNRWNKEHDTLFIEDPIILSRCIIGQIILPGQSLIAAREHKTTLNKIVTVFTKPVMITSCSVPPTALRNLCFMDEFSLINNNLSRNLNFQFDDIAGPQCFIVRSIGTTRNDDNKSYSFQY